MESKTLESLHLAAFAMPMDFFHFVLQLLRIGIDSTSGSAGG